MKGTILEISQKNNVSGRRFIKWVIHEIHTSAEEYNKNGISWKEEYVSNNIDTAINMPVCVEFVSDYDKSEPLGHGQSGIKDGQPIFEESVVVGTTEKAYIDNVEVKGKTIRALIGEGYIYEQRYPAFVDWLKTKMFDGDFPETSVEICAKKSEELEVIIYEDGWKEKGRVPMKYDYSGDVILGIEPSDDNAVLLELNSKNIKEEQNNMLDEKVVLELNNKIEEKTSEINQLRNELKSKDDAIKDFEQKVTEINSKVEEKEVEINSAKTELDNITSELNSVKSELEQKTSEINTLSQAIEELKQENKNYADKELVNELNSKLAEYDNADKDSMKEKIEECSKEPSKEKIEAIINEINASIVQRLIEAKKQMQIVSEQNSNKTVEDIYGDIFIETNGKQDLEDESIY